MTHGEARDRKWRGNSWMEWVASTLHTTSEHGVSSITTADAHTSAASRRLNWRPPADLNGLVRFAERRNLFSARVPLHFNRAVLETRGYETGENSCFQSGTIFELRRPSFVFPTCQLLWIFHGHTDSGIFLSTIDPHIGNHYAVTKGWANDVNWLINRADV